MIQAIFILVIIVGLVAVLRDQVRNADKLIKLSIFSAIVACLGATGSYIEEMLRIVYVIAIISLIICIIAYIYKFIMRRASSIMAKISIFLIFVAIAAHILALANIYLQLGESYVMTMIYIRGTALIGILIIVLIEVYKLIFGKSEKEKVVNDITEDLE